MLSDRQVRGQDCVFCGIALRAGAAVDLGARELKRCGATVRWFSSDSMRETGAVQSLERVTGISRSRGDVDF
ncbi:hypothetical protein AB0B50_15550 [Streptomyces sp. NPDC041068]|uniref:hypothetical protein n=1 Tax=Streptomyces sp. NPDC041068 TaxID=3155130 RepID=UPI0033CBAF4D